MRKSITFFLFLYVGCGGCDDETKGTPATCAAGETFNPITGACEPRTSQNNSTNSDAGHDTATDQGMILTDVDTPDVGTCRPGTSAGCSDDRTLLVCNAAGDGLDARACPTDEWCFAGSCGTQRCAPGTQVCTDTTNVGVCSSNGEEVENVTPCDDDKICDEGSCKSICDLGAKSFSYIGCEYWTVDLDQYKDPGTNPKPDEVPHAVVISNPGPADATLSFYVAEPGVVVNAPDPVVPAGEARAFTMPRLDVSGTGFSHRAIQIQSSSPVIAHQFNPLNNSNVFSNDASLLIPATEAGSEYYVMGWPTSVPPPILNFAPQHGYVTLVGSSGRAEVTITTTAPVREGSGFPAMVAGETRSVTLGSGQVLNLEAWAENVGVYDLTGTHIVSDVPITVFTGHEEAVIGSERPGDEGSCCADHLEQQLFPVNTWGRNYLAPASPTRGNNADLWRIVAARDNTTIMTDPPQPRANNVTINAGEFIEFEVSASFEVSANNPISVGQYLVSQEVTDDGIGDPALTLIPATEQFRADYHVLTPTGYDLDYILIVRPAGEEVRLDGTAVTVAFEPIGSSGFERGVVEVEPGLHVLTGAQPFGLIAYGYDNAVSYAYPGGLNLVGIDEDAN